MRPKICSNKDQSLDSSSHMALNSYGFRNLLHYVKPPLSSRDPLISRYAGNQKRAALVVKKIVSRSQYLNS